YRRGWGSSDNTIRHRFNRYGDLLLIRALHILTKTRMRFNERTKQYVKTHGSTTQLQRKQKSAKTIPRSKYLPLITGPHALTKTIEGSQFCPEVIHHRILCQPIATKRRSAGRAERKQSLCLLS